MLLYNKFKRISSGASTAAATSASGGLGCFDADEDWMIVAPTADLRAVVLCTQLVFRERIVAEKTDSRTAASALAIRFC